MDNPRTRDTFGGNNPLSQQRAFWDGHRSVRLVNGDIGLATTAYSYALSYNELQHAAERISLLWNLHLNETNEALRTAAPSPSPRPLEEWIEDHGDVVWWTWRDGQWLGEPAYIGSPLDLGRTYPVTIGDVEMQVTLGGWPGYHTHWTPHPAFPAQPSGTIGETNG